MQSLGEQIRVLRDEKDISLREFAKRLGISASFLSDIELGRRYPSKKVLHQLAKHLDVKPAELRRYDTRPPIEEVRRRVMAEPAFGIALRQVIDKKVSVDWLLKGLEEKSSSKEKKKK